MSGCGILTNGKGTRREYGSFNLDELREGDRIGMVRKVVGELHYFINGLDQGVAADQVPSGVWGVVDLYGNSHLILKKKTFVIFFSLRHDGQSHNRRSRHKGRTKFDGPSTRKFARTASNRSGSESARAF